MTTQHVVDPDPVEQVCGLCLDCRNYGFGNYAGRCTGIVDWITNHVGCVRPARPQVSTGGGVPAEAPVELGICPNCGARVYGRFIEDLTAYTSSVEHDGCPIPEPDDV
ncbi:hypothetical protein [Kitasatospora sp. NPDC088351]|uniref:hypothetical protein n=1 Tax=unclassified Kitasatospora TaxID=2633591 RepID=UPI003415A291